MRHLKKVKKLSRVSEHRKMMLRNMATSLLKNERIETTLTKAKALRSYVEPIITRAKKANETSDLEKILHQKRQVMRKIKDRNVIVKLFEDIALRYMNRNGGYTRIYKLGRRKGDNAEMALIELVEELLEKAPSTSKSTTTKKEDKSKMGKIEKDTEVKEEAKTETKTEAKTKTDSTKKEKKEKKESKPKAKKKSEDDKSKK